MKYKVKEVLTEAQVAFGFLPDDAREGEVETFTNYDALGKGARFEHAVELVVNQWITDGLEEDITVEVTDEDGEKQRDFVMVTNQPHIREVGKKHRYFVMITNRPRILGIHPAEG